MTYSDLKTKKAKNAFIREMVGSNEAWALRALKRVYANQTASEQSLGATVEHNGVGFSGADSEILSSFAEQVLQGRRLSAKQMAIVFKKMPRYARQLMAAAEVPA